MKIALYPGSFDPVTFGHLDIIHRSAGVFDELVVGVLNNRQKNALFSINERVNMIKELTKDIPNLRVESFDGLMVDYAREIHATAVIRGLQYPELETIFLTTDIHYSYLSSTIVREFASYGGDISHFVPASIIPKIMDKYHTDKKE